MKIPYKLVKTGKEKPLLPVTLGNPKTGASQRFYAPVDSGSDSCFFDYEYAEAIGLDVRKGKEGKIMGVVPGKWVTQYIHEIHIKFIGKRVTIEAGFVPGLSKHGFGILGQNGFFDQVQSVTFEKQKGVFEVVL